MFFQLYRTSGPNTASGDIRPSGLPTPHPRGTPAIRRRWFGCIQSPLQTDRCGHEGIWIFRTWPSLVASTSLIVNIALARPISPKNAVGPQTLQEHRPRKKIQAHQNSVLQGFVVTGTSSLNPTVYIQSVDLLTFAYPAQKTHCPETRTTKSSTAQKVPFSHRGPQHVP